MADRLKDTHALYEYLLKWRKEFPSAFRLDGKPGVGPANPAQWVFFEISDFSADLYSGAELGRSVNGTSWNGIYYLTAGTQSASVQVFLDLYSAGNGNLKEIFNLGYTPGKENLSTKRRLYLKADDTINNGWFCKQHVSKSWER